MGLLLEQGIRANITGLLSVSEDNVGETIGILQQFHNISL